MITINGLEIEGLITINEHELDEATLLQAIRNYIGQDIGDSKRIKIETRKLSFAKFYDQYGKKLGKEKAFKSWLKLKSEDITKIFETLPMFIKNNKDVKFRPLPASYLNGKRWEDDYSTGLKSSTPVLPTWAMPNTWEPKSITK